MCPVEVIRPPVVAIVSSHGIRPPLAEKSGIVVKYRHWRSDESLGPTASQQVSPAGLGVGGGSSRRLVAAAQFRR